MLGARATLFGQHQRLENTCSNKDAQVVCDDFWSGLTIRKKHIAESGGQEAWIESQKARGAQIRRERDALKRSLVETNS